MQRCSSPFLIEATKKTLVEENHCYPRGSPGEERSERDCKETITLKQMLLFF